MTKRKLLAGLTGVLSVVLLSTTASAYHMGEHHHGWNGGMGVGGGWFGIMMMLLWSLVVIAVVVSVIYWAFGNRGSDKTGSDAMEILRERYARGEIDEEEFRERKRHLSEG